MSSSTSPDCLTGRPAARISRVLALPAGLFAVLLLGGCSADSYQLMLPSAERVELSADPVAVSRTAVNYQVSQAAGRVVVQYLNVSGQEIERTSDSRIVDPTGRVISLPTEVLANGESGKLLLPPGVQNVGIGSPPTRDDFAAPTVGPSDTGGYIPQRSQPVAVERKRPQPETFNWPTNTRVRVVLVFQVGDETVEHDLTLLRE